MKNVNELSNKAKREDSDVSDRLSNFKHQVEDAAHDAGRSLRNFYDEKRGELQELSEEFSATVRRRPIQTSLAALAFGYLLGRLFSHKD